MQKYPSDVSVSETCIDANLKMVERRTQTTFPVSRRRNGAPGRQYPKLPLKGDVDLYENFHLQDTSRYF